MRNNLSSAEKYSNENRKLPKNDMKIVPSSLFSTIFERNTSIFFRADFLCFAFFRFKKMKAFSCEKASIYAPIRAF
jgi:hypothetical protein